MACTVTVTFELNANAPDHAWMVLYSYLKGKGVRRKDEATDGFGYEEIRSEEKR